MFVATLAHAVPSDTARLAGSVLVVEPLGVEVSLPPEWFGAKDTVSRTLARLLRSRAPNLRS